MAGMEPVAAGGGGDGIGIGHGGVGGRCRVIGWESAPSGRMIRNYAVEWVFSQSRMASLTRVCHVRWP